MSFHLFVYGTLRKGAGGELLQGCTRVGSGQVAGTLYDIDGAYPALLLYGQTLVQGDIWRCGADALPRLDAYEGTNDGLFRRVALTVREERSGQELPCWLYVAGPALSRKLTPDRRLAGPWQPASAAEGTAGSTPS